MDTYHRPNLKADLVDAAIALLSQPGESGTPKNLSLREVARKVGVSATAVYHHFSSKEALLEEVGVVLFQELIESWKGIGLNAMGGRYMDFFLRRPRLLDLLFGPQLGSSVRVQQLQLEAFRLLREALPMGAAQETDIQALFMWVLVHGLTSLVLSGSVALQPESCPNAPEVLYLRPGEIMEKFEPLLGRLLEGSTAFNSSSPP